MKDWLSIDEERRFLHCAQFSSMKSIVEQGEGERGRKDYKDHL